MMTIAEVSAAPHFPYALRPVQESNALSAFMQVLSAPGAIEVIEYNGELRLVSHPMTNG
ncbi:MAG: hypothetical protein ABL907_25125 [Hyphomicrobium sp.]